MVHFVFEQRKLLNTSEAVNNHQLVHFDLLLKITDLFFNPCNLSLHIKTLPLRRENNVANEDLLLFQITERPLLPLTDRMPLEVMVVIEWIKDSCLRIHSDLLVENVFEFRLDEVKKLLRVQCLEN